MLISEKYFILPILNRYWLRNTDVAIHIIKNEDKDNTSNVKDTDSVNGEPGRFVTYAEIGYGVTSVVFELGEIVKYDSR